MSWNKIIECVPNFSEGRDLEKIDKIVAPFRGKSGVKLLDYSNDEDHNRLVVTLVGEPEALCDHSYSIRKSLLPKHKGLHASAVTANQTPSADNVPEGWSAHRPVSSLYCRSVQSSRLSSPNCPAKPLTNIGYYFAPCHRYLSIQ